MFDFLKKLTGGESPLGGAGLGNTDEIWQHIKSGAGKAGRETTKMGLELFYVMKAPTTSKMNKVIIGSALAYQFLPTDLLSTKNFGALGMADNALALALAYKKVKDQVTPEISEKVNAQLNEWFKTAPQAAPQAATVEEPVAPASPEAPAAEV